MQTHLFTGTRIYPSTFKTASTGIQHVSTPALRFGGPLTDQELQDWLAQVQMDFQQGPIQLVSAEQGPEPTTHKFTFKFCGEDDTYRLTIFLNSSNTSKVLAASLRKSDGCPETQKWPGMYINFPYNNNKNSFVYGTYKIEKPNVVFCKSDPVPQTESFAPSVFNQALGFFQQLTNTLQQNQLYTAKETLANEYNQIQIRCKTAIEYHQLNHLSLAEKEAAEARHEKEMEAWEASLAPLGKKERKNQREIREEIEALATKQVADHAKRSTSLSFLQRLSALVSNQSLQFEQLT